MNTWNVKLEHFCNGVGLLSLLDDPWVRHNFRICVYDENDKCHEAGRMKASKLSYGEMSRRGLSLFMAFDDLSMETMQCYDVVFTKKGDLRKAFWHEYYGLEEYFARDFHFLDRIEIAEELKGQGLGKTEHFFFVVDDFLSKRQELED